MSRQNTSFIATKECLSLQKFCREKIRFVATKYFYRDKTFFKTNIGRDKIMFVATSILRLLSREKYACRDKTLSRQNTCLLRQISVATNICLLRQIFVATKVFSTFVAIYDVFCRDKQYLTRQTRFCRQNICRHKNDTCGSSRQ